MAGLVINAEDLIMALEGSGPDLRHYLDLQTGEIDYLLSEDYGDMEDDLLEKVESDPERYVLIDRLPSHVGWEVMSDFVESLRPGKIRDRLARAIEGRSPFRRFKDVLFDYPDTRDAWFAFEKKGYMELARDWLKREGIEADLKPLRGGDTQRENA
ncbi:MAG: hypothetical protein HY913_12300 [Desulfomonile tiedjei]|nr:hypothetical protein [Desulfomonile tiedjei]